MCAMLKQVNTVRWNRFPAPLIPVRVAECVVHLQTTPLTPVDVPLAGKVCVCLI